MFKKRTAMREKIEYPKWLYLDGEGIVVQDAEERKQYPEWGEEQDHASKGQQAVKVIASGIEPKKRTRKPKTSE